MQWIALVPVVAALAAADIPRDDLPAVVPEVAPSSPPAAKAAEPAEAKGAAAPPEAADAAAARAAAEERLKQLGEVAKEKAAEPAGKAEPKKPRVSEELRTTLQERLRLIDQWQKVAKDRAKAEHPETAPEQEVGELKAALERAEADLRRAAQDADSLLPDSFRQAAQAKTEAALSELKDAVGVAQEQVRDLKEGLETLRSESERDGGSTLAKLRDERDKLRQDRGARANRTAEQEAALVAAATPEERELAREKLANLAWEDRIASERLRELDAVIALEAGRAALSDLRIKTQETRLALATKTLERMQLLYRSQVERRQRDLERESEGEKARAAAARDPLERYRAQRAAELLDLRAQVLKDERDLTTSPVLALLQQQTELADRAKEDFEHLRELVTGGRASTLVALRLNNSYRRLASERAAATRNELARASAYVAWYENALTDVELDLLNDAKDDRLLRDEMLEALPPSRHAEALAVFERLEAQHKALLERRRRALAKLAAQAEAARRQVIRRIEILDEQHAFIRTHLFWVRDATPIGPGTLAQAELEGRALGRAALGLVAEVGSEARWDHVSAEFGLMVAAGLALPWPLYRVRRALRRRLDSLYRVQAQPSS
ncbi:MAG: hypothetical protein IRY99_09045 [Isosphaeraceae bacterium]|nr:hypothetical protein [Isosphaeraceae bacterium]